MTMKSFTSSRKVIKILNNLSHFFIYHTVKEIETEFSFEANKERAFTTHGMTSNSLLETELSWDNFERFLAIMTGTDSLHASGIT